MGLSKCMWGLKNNKAIFLTLGVVITTSTFVMAFHFKYITRTWKSQLYEGMDPRVNLDVSGSAKMRNDLACLSGVVLAKTAHGRLGNRLMEYASAWSLARVYNVTPIVSDEILKIIIPLFTNLSVPSASSFLRNLSHENAECAKVARKTLFEGPVTSLEAWLQGKTKEVNVKQPVILRPYLILAKTIASMQNDLKEEFVYRPRFLSYAEQTLRNASRVFEEDASLKGQIVFIGVHVRRTDYHRYLTRKFGVKKDEYADVGYYIGAMQHILKLLGEKGTFKAVFVVVSDDKEWSTKELIPAMQNYSRSQHLLEKKVTVSWCGSTDYLNDLVVLSSCNHTIASYGTYGTWASLMAGGWTVVYDIDADGTGKRNGAMEFAKLLPKWTVMR